MNFQDNHTRNTELLQEQMRIWDEKIKPYFPKNLEEIGANSGALKRKRGIHSIYDLLKILFLYACEKISFRTLAVAASALGLCAVSDTALRKRFTKATSFLHKILQLLLSDLVTGFPATKEMKDVLLVDASIVRQTGIKQEQERIHLCYNLSQNRMVQIKVTDHHTAESLSHFSFKEGNLVMADAGYGTAKNYIYVCVQKADAILRITPALFCLYDADDQKISLISKLRQAQKDGQELLELRGYCKYGNKKELVRIIAQKLPNAQAEQAKKRKKRKASKKQTSIAQDTLLCAEYIVLATTLGVEYSAEEILHLYRSRWQIELLFKRLKQNLSITVAKAGSKQYAETMILLQLIIGVIVEGQQFQFECCLRKKAAELDKEFAFSLYENSRTAFEKIKTILCLSWALFVEPTDDYIRFMARKKQRRTNQNEEFHSIVLPGLTA